MGFHMVQIRGADTYCRACVTNLKVGGPRPAKEGGNMASFPFTAVFLKLLASQKVGGMAIPAPRWRRPCTVAEK